MIFLINASNLKNGGGIQVTQSLCEQLARFEQHRFVVVLSSFVSDSFLKLGPNTYVRRYDIKNNLSSLAFGRDSFLDELVVKEKVDAVLTVFGPSRWRPKTPHLCGFARAQIILTDSPYYRRLTLKDKLLYKIWTWSFKRCSKYYYTENKYISDKLPQLLGNVKVYTVSNYYNQIYDQPERWRRNRTLPTFDGITCLSISTHYPHKNFEMIIDIVRELKHEHPDFKVRFVLTFEEKEMPVPDDLKNAFVFIGKTDVSECPSLYEQSDIMFMPTLMECFTATYPEAMRMEVPIVTTDLEFARGLCGDAACYYSAVDPKAAVEAIYMVATDKEYAKKLVENGKKQLNTYDNYKQRADKLINILEEIA